jgi:hypothetical protein
MLLITTDPLVGYLALSTKSYGNAEASHEAIQCNLTARKGTVESPYSCYLHTTCSTWTSKHLKTYAKPYCDNHSLLIPHSSGYQLIKLVPYMNPDHDVTMTLSALRAKLTFRLASLNVPRSSRRTLRLQPTPATCTTQRSFRRTRFRSTRGTPRSGTTYRILPIARKPRLPA